jgi:hypothetical protein
MTQNVIANQDCAHEIDDDTPFEYFEMGMLEIYNGAGFYCCCRNCGGTGVVVDGVGIQWLNGSGEYE